MKTSEEKLSFIGECFLKDIDIKARLDHSSNIEKSVQKLSQIFTSYAKRKKVIYTAFDGDHFHLLQNMRKFVIKKNGYPANPESILGYKNIVTRYQNKYGVLSDDLAILRNCDELWIFTDYGISKEDVLDLPEGVLIELSFFLKRRSSPIVNFVSLSTLINKRKQIFQRFSLTFQDMEDLLLKSKRREIIDLANNNFKIDKELKDIVFFITDPLDFKYSEWLREGRNSDEIALVPGIASKISDSNPGLNNIGNIILSWAALLTKLSQRGCVILNSDSRRTPSIIVEALKNYFIQTKGIRYISSKNWKEFHIPKCLQKEKWPITKYEADMLQN